MDYIIRKIKENRLTVAGVAAGAVAGFLYWHFVGCLDGTCPINASPIMNILRGAAIGGLLFAFIDSIRKNNS